MIITKDVLRRADAIKSKALKYIKEEEPELYTVLETEMEANLPKLIETIKTANPAKAQQSLIDFLKNSIGLAFMSETIARDIMESRKNPSIAVLVKKNYEDITDALERTVPQGDEPETKDVVGSAIKEIEDEKDRP
jgi:hypothetical protein